MPSEPAGGETGVIRDRLRAVQGARGVLLLAVMLSGPPLMALTFSAISPVLPAIGLYFGGAGSRGAFVAQWIMTTPAIGLMIGAPASGMLLDRLGVRRLILAALAGFALGGAAGLYAESLGTLLLGRFVMGLSGATLTTGTTWLIAARHDEAERRRLIAAQDAISGVAAMTAVLLSGVLGQSGGWRMPFAIYLVAVPLFGCALATIPALRRQTDRSRATPPATALTRLWPVYALVLALAGLMMMPATQVPFVLEAIGVQDPVARSYVIAASALLSILSAASFPWVRARAGEVGTLRLILAGYGIGTALISVAPNAAMAAAGCAFMGAATGLFSPHFASLVIARAEPALRARAIGLMFGFVFLSEFLSPAVVLPLRAALGVQGGFAALAVMLAAGLLASFGRLLIPTQAREGLR